MGLGLGLAIWVWDFDVGRDGQMMREIVCWYRLQTLQLLVSPALSLILV